MKTGHAKTICLLLFFSPIVLFSQSYLTISNEIQGDIIGFGFGTGTNGQPDTVFKSYPFDCSQCEGTIKAIVLASESNFGVSKLSEAIPLDIEINNVIIRFSNSTRIGEVKTSSNQAFVVNHFATTTLPINNNSIDIIIPPQQLFHPISCFYLILECKKTNAQKSSYIVVINDKTSNTDLITNSSNLILTNPINLNSNVGFALAANALTYITNDEQLVSFNGGILGYPFLADQFTSEFFSSGTNGHFQYGNGVLSGLDDDNPDFIMDSTDALSNVQTLINGNSFMFESKANFPGNKSNHSQAIILSYQSTCPSFSYTHSSDTTICPNEPLQLFATGGVSYEWLPAAGLSCSTCANPVFVGDSSQLYTVRIWGNDSCSVVRPVMVHVRQQPTIASLVTSVTTCGLNQGTLQGTLADSVAVQFSLDNGPLQDTSFFSNLAAGSHTLSLHDAVGCSFDTLVNIAADTTVSALFTATPSSGAAPLQVTLTNQSINATNYVWQLAGVTQANPFTSFTVTDTGAVYVQLIAYQNNPSCADTAWASIFVYDSVIVSVPNVFSPNNDNTNEFFGITSNTPLIISGALVNRWGQTMVAWENQATSTGFSQLWNGTTAGAPASEGVYFYHISWHTTTQKGKLEGNVSLVK